MNLQNIEEEPDKWEAGAPGLMPEFEHVTAQVADRICYIRQRVLRHRVYLPFQFYLVEHCLS